MWKGRLVQGHFVRGLYGTGACTSLVRSLYGASTQICRKASQETPKQEDAVPSTSCYFRDEERKQETRNASDLSHDSSCLFVRTLCGTFVRSPIVDFVRGFVRNCPEPGMNKPFRCGGTLFSACSPRAPLQGDFVQGLFCYSPNML